MTKPEEVSLRLYSGMEGRDIWILGLAPTEPRLRSFARVWLHCW